MRDELRFAVAIHVLKRRRLTFDAFERKVFFPMPRLALRVFIPKRLMQMHATQHQDVGPTVSVEIVHEAEHGICGARLSWKWFRRVELVLVCEARSFIPKRPGHNI